MMRYVPRVLIAFFIGAILFSKLDLEDESTYQGQLHVYIWSAYK